MSRQQLQLLRSDNRFAALRPEDLNEDETTSLVDLALQALALRHRPGKKIQSPRDAISYFRLLLAPRRKEVFACLFLDNTHRILAVEELFEGTLTQASVYPREVVLSALRANAAAVLFAHNHPSGDPTPSRCDEKITKVLKDALVLLDIRVLDHIVVGAEGVVSMAENGFDFGGRC
jgi:DNA repair protein RadC